MENPTTQHTYIYGEDSGDMTNAILGSKLPSISPFDSVISQGRGLTRILKYRSDMRYFGGMGFGRMGGVVVGEREHRYQNIDRI